MIRPRNIFGLPVIEETEESPGIYFWPKTKRSSQVWATKAWQIGGDIDDANADAARARTAAIFSESLINDPLDKSLRFRFWARDPSCQTRVPFRLVPSEFLRRARYLRPKDPEPTVSAFAQWLYSLYSSDHGEDEDRDKGKAIEATMVEARRLAAASTNDVLLSELESDWRLLHNGLHGANQTGGYFKIDDLLIGNEQLRASPDLVFQNQVTSDIVIVEIKYSRMKIPTNLWPNVWGQLWCYSQLKFARSARNVTIVGEVWGERWVGATWRRGSMVMDGIPLLCLRASVRRDPRDPAFDRFFRSLFSIYCGCE